MQHISQRFMWVVIRPKQFPQLLQLIGRRQSPV